MLARAMIYNKGEDEQTLIKLELCVLCVALEPECLSALAELPPMRENSPLFVSLTRNIGMRRPNSATHSSTDRFAWYSST